MKKPEKITAPIIPQSTIPAWTCPKCGTTHPITVPACCRPPIDRVTFPVQWPVQPIPQWPDWANPPVICGAGVTP